MRVWVDRLHRVEDGLLVMLLSSMILLAGTQIFLRNFFGGEAAAAESRQQFADAETFHGQSITFGTR